ncbi:unnamed protein product [Brachionus calyciflorus]|uniref:CCHC-type domain-containing protein n=1 Tax=Brachionus calyciflorus TaxID=104777 RepID=A0A814GYP8_9BILA|nr:unnamed protein product [Brachionus calyciflorus]
MASSEGPSTSRSFAQDTRNTIQANKPVKKQISKKHFINTFLIHNKNKDQPFLRDDILNSLADLIGNDICHLDYLSQHDSNRKWYVTFRREFSINHLYDTEIKIGDQMARIENPFIEYDPIYTFKYRISWLPHNFEQEYVKEWFSNFTTKEIIVEEEYEKSEKLKHVKNGNFRVTIRVKRSNSVMYEKMSGVSEINGFKFLISRLGKPPICLLCKKEGHVKRNCVSLSLKCDFCNKIGHLSENCSLSKRIDREFEELVDLPDQNEEMDFIDVEKKQENKVESKETKSTPEPLNNLNSNEDEKKKTFENENDSDHSQRGESSVEYDERNNSSADDISEGDDSPQDNDLTIGLIKSRFERYN